MNKTIEITMSNGEVWQIPVDPVAKDRATYYARKDTKDDPSLHYDDVFREEYEYTISSSYELMDWLQNNMNCEDIEPFAVKVQNAPIRSFKELWNDSLQLKVR